MTREQVFNIIRFLYKHLAHVVIENEDQVPPEGPCIITLNHNSRIDFPALIDIKRHNDVYAVAADKYKTFQAKEGVVLLASKTHAPIVSLSITGTEAFMKDFLHFRKPVITLRFGPAYELPAIDPDNREESLRAAADEVMCHIAAMLPERYRGFYKDYPRVKELNAEWKARGDLKMPE